jgi:hypothetical protein
MRWLRFGYLPGCGPGGSAGSGASVSVGFAGIHGMAGGRSGAERAVCDKFCAPKPALVEGICQGGEFAMFCVEYGEERLSHELGYEVGVQAFLLAPAHARLILFSLWRTVLQVCFVAF